MLDTEAQGEQSPYVEVRGEKDSVTSQKLVSQEALGILASLARNSHGEAFFHVLPFKNRQFCTQEVN